MEEEKKPVGKYTPQVMEHFMNPRKCGAMENPSGVGRVGNEVCGDEMWIYIKVENDTIVDVSFETFGCVAAIASSSVTMELIVGKTLAEALKITNDMVVKRLGGLPPNKIHCSVLAEEGIKSAIEDFLTKSGRKIEELLPE